MVKCSTALAVAALAGVAQAQEEPVASLTIVNNNSAIVMGESGDVTLTRSDGSLVISSPMGVDVDGSFRVNGRGLDISSLMTAHHLNARQLGGQAALNSRSNRHFLDTSLVVWLRASDMVYTSKWNDHRGWAYHSGDDVVTCTGLDLDSDGVVFDEGDSSYCQIPTVDISPFNMPAVTMSVWLKVNSFANTRGWLLTHDDGGCDRSILMHDTRWGEDDDGNGVMGLGAGCTATKASSMGSPPLNSWIHVVGVWNVEGDGFASMYANMDSQHFEESGEGSGDTYLTLGGHDSATNHYVDGTIGEVRVYNRALTPAEVGELHISWDPALLLWLEAGDYNPLTPDSWTDRRAYEPDSKFTSPYTVVAQNVTQTAEGKVTFMPELWYSFINIEDLDISPSAHDEVTISMWVKLNSYYNNRGWFVHTDNGGYDRSILMHDDRFGKLSDGTGYTALGVGTTFTSDAGVTPLNEWVHIAAVWVEGEASHLYRNGEAFSEVVESTDNNDGREELTIGGWYNDGTSHSTDADFDSIRVYGRALSDTEIENLYAEDAKQYLKNM